MKTWNTSTNVYLKNCQKENGRKEKIELHFSLLKSKADKQELIESKMAITENIARF